MKVTPIIKIGDGPGGNYEAKVLKLTMEHLAEIQGQLVDIDIQHDNWCAVHGGHPCNCDTDVTIRKKLD